MSDTVIKVEGLGKLYKLGEIGTGTLSHDLNRWWARVRGKEDPFAKIGDSKNTFSENGKDYIWALKDINFEVKQGQVLGIIGRNGAGKTTLLKILSKITTPTTGKIKLKGRIASLLEVGTGFHNELTGRENIYLNGAILGMTSNEIKNKFDQIVDFAGLESHIDTPVKRYSDGMYVRLAFAIAAHLEPEILIIDEVLAVGDLEFQKKCLGKMQDVSKTDGRTIFFVSHQMDAIRRLCKNVAVLDSGALTFFGDTDEGLGFYLKGNSGSTASYTFSEDKAPGNDSVRLLEVKVINEQNENAETHDIRKKIGIVMKYRVLKDQSVFTHGINLFNREGIHVLSSHDRKTDLNKTVFNKGVYRMIAWIPANFLAEGTYSVSAAIMSYNPFYIHFHERDIVSFTVVDTIEGDSARGNYGGMFPGVTRPLLEWDRYDI